jgi:cyclopropane fatty-acyl-phospholipid synthase-like methyltransferase
LNSLDLYSLIEEELGFSEEISELYNFYFDFATQQDVASLIDIGCGQGDFLKKFPNSINTLGVDLSAEQIKVCIDKGLNAKCIDVKDVNEKFEIATAIFDVVNYIPKNDLHSFFKNLSNILEVNGYFLFDINTYFGFDEIAQGSLNINKKNKFIAIDAFFEDNTLITNINLFEQHDGLYKREQNNITQYFHSQKSIKESLIKTGLQLIEIVDFNLHSQEIPDKQILILKKQNNNLGE